MSKEEGDKRTFAHVADLKHQHEVGSLYGRLWKTLVYQGTGPSDLLLNHVLPIGCTSQRSVIPIGDDIYFLSPYGVTNLKKFFNGTQLVQNMVGFAIAPLMHQMSSMDGWARCVAYHDIEFRRVIWWLPQGDVPNQGFVYQYDVQSWSRFDGWSINSVTRASGGLLIAGTLGGKLMILNQGPDDNGVEIDAHYTTAWFDKGEPERNMTCPFMEIWLRVSGVKISLTSSWDQGDLVDSHSLDYLSTGSEWGQTANDVNANLKWWGPSAGSLTETVKPSDYDVVLSVAPPNAAVTYPARAYDLSTPDDLTTWSTVYANSIGDILSRTATLIVKTIPALPVHTYFMKTLKINLATILTNAPGNVAVPNCSVYYSIDGGVSWTNVVTLGYDTVVLQTYSVPLNVAQDLSLVRVKMTAYAPIVPVGIIPYGSTIEGLLSDVWVEGIYSSGVSPVINPEGTWQNSSWSHVRTDIYGIGRVVQFTFQMNGSGDCEILAYRPDLRSKGLL